MITRDIIFIKGSPGTKSGLKSVGRIMALLSVLTILHLKQRANWTRKGELSPVKCGGKVFTVLLSAFPPSLIEGCVTLRHRFL